MKDINLFSSSESLYFKQVSTKKDVSLNDTCDGYILDTDEKEARRIIEYLKSSKKLFAFLGGDNALNRRALEKLNIHFLLSPERGWKKNNLKQRDSGLNHVTVRIAAKKKISILVNCSELCKLSPREKAQRISKILQNVILCRKAKCSLSLVSLAYSPKGVLGKMEREALGVSFGMSSQQIKEMID